MDRIKSTIRLLSLLSLFFIYRAIMGAIDNNSTEIILWTLITVIYIISLIILYFMAQRWEKQQK
ncbi:MAG: hypothetical protein ACFE9Z_04850 [Promethearchaeota archaeon]